jgi:WhiB family transcriptional regulator, redox-sensing transcriptional regulator
VNGFEAPPAWTARALCAETMPDEFFPSQGESPKRAKLICGQCPVTTECLTYALDNREPFGVWGGATERERHKMLHGKAS